MPKTKQQKKAIRNRNIKRLANIRRNNIPKFVYQEVEVPVKQNKVEMVNETIGYGKPDLKMKTVMKNGRPEVEEVGKKIKRIKQRSAAYGNRYAKI